MMTKSPMRNILNQLRIPKKGRTTEEEEAALRILLSFFKQILIKEWRMVPNMIIQTSPGTESTEGQQQDMKRSCSFDYQQRNTYLSWELNYAKKQSQSPPFNNAFPLLSHNSYHHPSSRYKQIPISLQLPSLLLSFTPLALQSISSWTLGPKGKKGEILNVFHFFDCWQHQSIFMLQLMSNKKQVHLKTITLDWPTALNNSSYTHKETYRPKGSFLLAPKNTTSRPFSASCLELNVPTKSNIKSKMSHKQSLCMNKVKHMEINRTKVQVLLDSSANSSSVRSSHSYYQQFPKRQNPFKNGNAFKYYLNSDSAQKNYTQSMQLLERMHSKVKQLTQKKPKPIRRPQTGKLKINTQPVSDIFSKNLQQTRCGTIVTHRNFSHKRNKCKTENEFSPWQTKEEKRLSDW